MLVELPQNGFIHLRELIIDCRLFRKSCFTLIGVLGLLLMMVAPVYAAPSLSLGSNAFYNLMGKIQARQSCSAASAEYTLQACFGITPPPPPPPPPNVTIWIRDDGFVPAKLDVYVGSTIVWINNGTLAHSVASNDTVSHFNSGSIPPGGNFSYTLKFFGGTFHYYNPSFPWTMGTIVPFGCLIPEGCGPSQQGVVPVTLPLLVEPSGTIGWNIEGLSSSQANLNVSHQVSVSVSALPRFGLKALTESGSFEQCISLSTRLESPSTATGIVQSLSTSLLSAMVGTALTTGATGPIFQNMLFARSNTPAYTVWWVNEPLSLGSPVQILHGWSSVTGSESLDLGGSFGTRSAWTVTSKLSQTVNLTIPNPSTPLSQTTSNVAASLKLLWSYDKSTDLLLRNDNAASLAMHSATPTLISTPTGPVTVTVTRDMTLAIDIALLLSSTNLSLPNSPSHSSTLMDLLSAMARLPLGIAGLTVGIAAGLFVWISRRAKRATQLSPPPFPVGWVGPTIIYFG